jgi:hypothetical protein
MAIKMRALLNSDIQELQRLHELYFSHLEFPPFADCLNAFVIEDEKNEIVLGASLEMVAEAMLVTNKAKSEIKIGKALVEAHRYAEYTCRMRGIRDLYAFVDRDSYGEHLKQHGFIESDRALKLRIP